MKTKLLFLLSLLWGLASFGQFGPQQIISTDAQSAYWVHTTDIDGDGDLDVLSASFTDNKIAWYENTDGLGTFGSQQIISSNANWAKSVFAADLDGDGDMDVLSASFTDGKFAWYENTDGQGNFGPQQVISSEYGAVSIYASDLDGDGDMDVLSATQFEEESDISWYENTDGQGTFGPPQIISDDVNEAISASSADIDGDGDLDVLSVSYNDNKIAWYENIDGQGTFGPQLIISTEGIQPWHATFSDIDGDGDIDVVAAILDDKITWFENTDGLGDFGPARIISAIAEEPWSVYAADIDGDGDLDVLSTNASSATADVVWYENTDGQGNFGFQQIITNFALIASRAIAADIDNDGDMDVLSASFGDNKIAWYENLNPLSVNENNRVQFSVFPIPASDFLTIESTQGIVRIEIFNKLGQFVSTKSFSSGSSSLFSVQNEIRIDVSELSKGSYFLKATDINENSGVKIFVKQ